MNRWMLWLKTNTGLKLVSLVLAAFIWFFVKAITSAQRTVEGVPLEIRVRPGLVAHSNPRFVNVTVRGAAEDLRSASRTELFAVLDLTTRDAPGTFVSPLTPRAIRPPRRLQVVAVEPTNVLVRLDQAPE
jgi:hypothetical protein